MKKIILFHVIFFILCGHAYANVSRIHKDHHFSGNIKQVKTSDHLKLYREDIRVVFPMIELDSVSLQKKIDMDVNYIIENQSTSAIEIPLQFLGISVSDAIVLLNEKSILLGFVEDNKAEQEFLARITEHRHQWNKRRYEQYFIDLDYIKSGKKMSRSLSLIHMTAPEFIRVARNIENLSEVFPGAGKLNVIRFHVRLLPGKNKLTIRYKQGLFVDGHTSYIGGPAFVCGFEYLLYPAFTWKMNPDFELFVSVTLPDYLKKGWLWDSRITPLAESNLTLKKMYNSQARVTTYSMRSKSFPAPVLAFIALREKKD
ncbi:MAG TPA: hypothetical protein PK178_00440 [Smithellaceae bacterium]|jgi:hypothetical protein|nr:hypothetical protein [Smithellaceae bacterium]